MNRAATLRQITALVLALPVPCAAQNRPPAPTPEWRWYLTASVGLVGREIATWKPIHSALGPTGWDSQFQSTCVYYCANSSDNAQGRPVAPTVTLRRQFDETWQLRLMGTVASPGYYPGGYTGTPLRVEPKTVTAALQGVMSLHAFWLAAGPSLYRGRVTTTAGAVSSVVNKSGVGLVLTGGVSFPRVTNWFVEMTLERRFAGSVSMPVLPVAGLPDVPAFTVPLSATVLSVGVGWRL